MLLIHRRDTLRATKIYLESLKKAENIEFVFNTTVADLITDNRLKGIKVKNTLTKEETELSVDGLFVSIGRKPSTELFRDILELDENGYIIADETTKTNIDGVFAVGDVRKKHLRQIVTAVSDGAVGAHFAEEYISSIL